MKKSLGTLLSNARYTSKKSQEYVSLELGVARKTIQNWENDVSAPTIDQAIKFFDCLGLSPLPYLFEYVFPSKVKEDDETLRKELFLLIEALPIEGVKQLINLFYGEHGSSPRAIMNLVSAHLELPMRDRITCASTVIKQYELQKRKGLTQDRVDVDIEFLKKALEEGEEAYFNNEEGYVMEKEINK